MSGTVVGAILNDTYRLERVIGQGGMGVVFEAAHLRVPRRFAIKMLAREAIANRAIFERFQREAEIASSLGSEHITQVFDFNYTDDGTPYMVLELLEGEDLAARLERGAMTLAEAVAVVEQVTRALEIAHDHGIIHRDLKPSNIFLCKRPHRPDVLKVLDFGISKVLHGGNQATRTGLVMGTPSYMAPEQAEGRAGDIDQRTDLFAFGAIIYECLTGKVAFEAPSAVGTIYQVCHAEPAPMRELAPELPRAMEQVIARALSKQRDGRYASARELRDDFVRACSTVGDQTVMLVDQYDNVVRAAGTGDRTTLSSAAGASASTATPEQPKHRWLPAVVVSAVAGVAALAFVTYGSSSSAPSPERRRAAGTIAPVGDKAEPAPPPVDAAPSAGAAKPSAPSAVPPNTAPPKAPELRESKRKPNASAPEVTKPDRGERAKRTNARSRRKSRRQRRTAAKNGTPRKRTTPAAPAKSTAKPKPNPIEETW